MNSAGDRVKDIKNKPHKIALMYLINFEIWGTYKNSVNKGLLSRRDFALVSLGHLTTSAFYEIKVIWNNLFYANNRWKIFY